MSLRSRVDAFEAWLRQTGTPEEIARFHRSVAEGFVAVAGPARVTAAHVETSCKLARDAGMDVTAMEALGALFVRYAESDAADAEEPAPATPRPAPVVTPLQVSFRAPTVDPSTQSVADIVATIAPEAGEAPATTPEARDASEASEPPLVTMRAATGPITPRAPTTASAPSAAPEAAGAETPAEAADAPAVDAEPSAPRPRRAPRGLAIGAVVALGAGVAWYARGAADDAEPAAAPTSGLARLGLGGELPAGWRMAPEARVGALGSGATTVLARGGAPDDPDERAFLATLPLPDALADGADAPDAPLVAAAHRAELGSSARLTASGGAYQSGGCRIAAVGDRVAVCRGTVHAGGATFALQTYLSVDDHRAVVALFLAKLGVAEPARSADAVVGALRL